MEINRQNYEEYLLDLMEGRLDEETAGRLKEFLLRHPEFGEKPEQGAWFQLEPESVRFTGRDNLKKDLPGPENVLTDHNFDMFSIARMEGDLTPEQEKAHESMVAAKGKWRKQWDQWQKTRLEREAIPFMWKGSLRKKANRPGRVLWISIIAAAATVALVFTLLRTGVPGKAPDPGLTGIQRQETSRTPSEQPLADAAGKVVNAEVEQLAQENKPVSLSIRKHQDPPELTGNDLNESPTLPTDSSISVPVESIEPGPVDMSLSSVRIASIAETGTYDRINPIFLPPMEDHEASLDMTALSEKGLIQASQDFLREKDITLLGIASAGIQGFSRLTGADLTFGISRDENGKISVIRFRSDLLSVDAPLRKPQ